MAWDPTQYERFADERSRPFYDLLSLVKSRPMNRAVDLGCGTGKLTRDLFDRLGPAEMVGVDNSAEMLERAASFATAGLRFESGDLSTWNAPSGTFDLVFTNAALQWIPNHEELIPRILATVAPGGQFAMQVPCNTDHLSHGLAARLGNELYPVEFPEAVPPIRVFPVERYAEILHARGFSNPIARVEVYGNAMASGREVIEWVKGTLLTRYAEVLGPARFTAFLERYTRELLGAIGEGAYFYAFKRTLIWGERG